MVRSALNGVVEHGRIVVSQPVDLPDGSPVLILPLLPKSAQQKLAALKRLRSRAIPGLSLPAAALESDALYEDPV